MTNLPPREPQSAGAGRWDPLATIKPVTYVLVLLFIVYNVITGATIQEIGLPGMTVKFGPKTSGSPAASQPASPSQSATLQPSTSGVASPGTPPPSPPTSPPPAAPDVNATKLLTSAPRSATSGGLTLTVVRIEQQGLTMNVVLQATNKTSDSLNLPIFGDFSLIDDKGKAYPANSFAGDWPGTVPPGAQVKGTIVVTQPLDSGAQTMQAGFSQVYGSLSIQNITVRGIPVRG